MSAGFISVIKNIGWLPHNIFTNYVLYIGSALEMLTLSIGMGMQLRDTRYKLKRFQMERLKRIIQPHYLLNSLHAIAGWMSKNPVRANEAIEALSNEFRGIIEITEKKLISAADEVELCRSHLKIMSLRKLTDYTLTTENIVETEMIPPLIFHSIIENGIKHEIVGEQAVTFHIKRTVQGKRINYSIYTKGKFTTNSQKRSGVGSSYIHSRLEEAFPGKWELEQKGTSDGWLTNIIVAK